MNIKHLHIKQQAFTLIELIVGIAVVGILTAVALPSLGQFSVGLRVEGEISELNRLILITRNTAISSGNTTTICPLDSSTNTCTDQWDAQISVFEDLNGNGVFNPPAAGSTVGDIIIKVKDAINTSDQLQFSGGTSLIYSPRGNLTGNTADNTFSYCPAGYTDESKGIVVSALGRPYVSQDLDGDGDDEDRAGNAISCS